MGVEFPILNLDETQRFWIDYKVPSGYQASKSFDTFEEADKYIEYLNGIDRDPSFIVSILGYYIFKEHYIQVIHKVKVLH